MSSKVTMADGGPELDEVMQAEEEIAPKHVARMPHNEMPQERLDVEFPSVAAPGDEDLEDLDRDENDAMLIYGRKVAEQIANDMAAFGRTRANGKGR